MRLEAKIAIIQRFLEEKSQDASQIKNLDNDTIKNMPFFKELSESLDNLAGWDPVVSFSTLAQDADQWAVLSSMLQEGLTLSPGNPPEVLEVDYRAMRHAADRIAIAQLPQPDYYKRTSKPNPQAQDMLNNLIQSSQTRLGKLIKPFWEEQEQSNSTNQVSQFIKTFLAPSGQFNPANSNQLSQLISRLQQRIKQAEASKNEKALASYRTQLTLVEDLNNINQLKILQIPTEFGPFNYCQLAESAGGVTEKVSLMSLPKVISQLMHLDNAAPTSLDQYMGARSQYKLSTEAILKLPKHGKVEEVQREALALNFSRLSGLDTTQSSMIMHQGKPALFVPFDDIRLLSEFAHGKMFKTTGLIGSKTYEHYSTLDPVGSGLQANGFIEDFGKSLGVFYLCSDPDFVGGYNQNKALRDSKSLYMFDMVVMPDDKLALDSRLSLQPAEIVMKHTRHGQGRNRTMIEDSAFQKKFDSLMALARNEDRILAYLTLTIEKHEARINELTQLSSKASSAEAKEIKAEISQVALLKKDAEGIKQSTKSRISKLFNTLPATKKISMQGIAKGLILEKLLNKPTLFTDDGRPYRNPWTYRNATRLTSMEYRDGQGKHEDNVFLTFSDTVPLHIIHFLNRHGVTSLTPVANRDDLDPMSMEISVKDLDAINENILYPETHLDGLLDTDYLDRNDLQAIGDAYGEGHRTRILSLIQKYKDYMASTGKSAPTHADKLKTIHSVDAQLLAWINTAKDKGFGMQVLKKLQFDIQQQLRRMIPEHQLPPELDRAFSAALKLDQVSTFNRVLATAIENQSWNSDSDPIPQFLRDCIAQHQQAVNHDTAVKASSEVARLSQETIKALKKHLKEAMKPGIKGKGDLDVSDFFMIDAKEIQQEQLEKQHKKIAKTDSMTNTNTKEEKTSEIPAHPPEVKL